MPSQGQTFGLHSTTEKRELTMPRVVIDYLPSSASRYVNGWAIVAVDVIRATTTAITAAARGRKCFPVPSLEAAFALHRKIGNSVLAGEIGGEVPGAFHMNNSPAELFAADDTWRPVILLSSSGTRLIWESRLATATYLACFRNQAAVGHALRNYSQVALIGAGTRDEFREEDQMCCAAIAEALLSQGFEAGNAATLGIIDRWSGKPVTACLESKSVAYLKRSNQLHDLEFILGHVNDLHSAFTLERGEVVAASAIPAAFPQPTIEELAA
jgi:2-phosphosulfolactate phosphatase